MKWLLVFPFGVYYLHLLYGSEGGEPLGEGGEGKLGVEGRLRGLLVPIFRFLITVSIFAVMLLQLGVIRRLWW